MHFIVRLVTGWTTTAAIYCKMHANAIVFRMVSEMYWQFSIDHKDEHDFIIMTGNSNKIAALIF